MNSLILITGGLYVASFIFLSSYFKSEINADHNNNNSLKEFNSRDSDTNKYKKGEASYDIKNSNFYIEEKKKINEKNFTKPTHKWIHSEEVNAVKLYPSIQPIIPFHNIERIEVSDIIITRDTGGKSLPSVVLLSLGDKISPNGIIHSDRYSPMVSNSIVSSGKFAPIIMANNLSPMEGRSMVSNSLPIDFSVFPSTGSLSNLSVSLKNKDGSPLSLTGSFTCEIKIKYFCFR
ncbi:hypothetical protein ACTFIY_011423 [Dictyostelium cf. discoideum]